MPRLKSPHQDQPVHALYQPSLRSIDCIALQRFLPECLLAVECHRMRDSFVALPVADPVCVAGPEDDGECVVGLEERGEGWEVIVGEFGAVVASVRLEPSS